MPTLILFKGLFLFQDSAGPGLGLGQLLTVMIIIVIVAVVVYLARRLPSGGSGGNVMDGSRKIIGVLFLIGGIVVAVFGIMYMSSPQYKAMSVVDSVTGSRQDPTGYVAISIGAVLSVIGLIALLGGGSANANTATRSPGGVQSSADGDYIAKLERLGELKTKGLLTEEEYAEEKRKLLS
jgi:hypothetical protein